MSIAEIIFKTDIRCTVGDRVKFEVFDDWWLQYLPFWGVVEKVIVNKEKDDCGKYVYFPVFLVRLEKNVKEYEDYEISEYRDKDGIIRLWIDESDILLVRSAEATAGNKGIDND